jgi:hypothetical protein
MYGQALKAAGLDQKLEVRNGDRIEKHKFFKFHMHVYCSSILTNTWQYRRTKNTRFSRKLPS